MNSGAAEASDAPSDPSPAALTAPTDTVADEAADAFEAAARLFSFTGENPIIAPVAETVTDSAADEPEAPASASHRAPRRARRSGSAMRRLAATGFSMGVMVAVGLLTVAVTVPAEALAAATQADAVTSIAVASDEKPAKGAKADKAEKAQALEAEDLDVPIFDGGAFAATGGIDPGAELYDQAVQVVMRDKKASTSYIQRRLQIGYNRAASIMERMEIEGIVGPANHAGKRDILMDTRSGH